MTLKLSDSLLINLWVKFKPQRIRAKKKEYRKGKGTLKWLRKSKDI